MRTKMDVWCFTEWGKTYTILKAKVQNVIVNGPGTEVSADMEPNKCLGYLCLNMVK